jgi:biopolymer transport protein ExbB/TolQ
MGSALVPIIVTIGISTLVIVASIIGTLFVLLNYLGRRIDQASAELSGRIDQASAELSGRIDQESAELGGRIDQAEARITQAASKDKAELLDAIRDTERRMTEATRDSEQRLSRRMDRFEDKTDANFETLRRESSERITEQPVAGDD